MADTKVSNLPASSALTGTELFYSDNGAADVKVTANQIKTFASGGAVAASSVTFTPAGNVASTNVQAAIAEVDAEKVPLAGGTMTGMLTLAALNPVGNNDATRKLYVDNAVANANANANMKVALAGDTMSGPLVLSADPTVALGAATKQYVDNKPATDSTKVLKAGDTMTGPLVLSADPGTALGAATKQYVDAKPAGIADAPADGTTYGRNNNAWVAAGGGSFLPLTGGTLTGNLTISKTQPVLALDRTSATNAQLRGMRGGLMRWLVQLGDSIAETGSNVGSDFSITNYDDAGNSVSANTAFSITRSNAQATFGGPVSVTGTQPSIILNSVGGSGNWNWIASQKGGLNRWVFNLGNGVAESGGNAGSNLTIAPCADAGTTLNSALGITRSTGRVYVSGLDVWNTKVATDDRIALAKDSAAQNARITGKSTSLVTRWGVNYANSDTESGSNSGTNFAIERYDDSGTLLGNAVFLNRATGAVTLPNLTAGGTVSATAGTGALTVSSDERLKNLLGPFTRGLDALRRIGGADRYAWKDDPQQREQAGFIAQKVQTAIPEAVGVGDDGMLSLSDRPLIAALMNAVLELADEVAALKARAA